MDFELMNAVTALAERLVILAAQDEGLRDALRSLAAAVLTAAERSSMISESRLEGPDAGGRQGCGLEVVPLPAEEGPQPVTAAVPEVAQPGPRMPLPELTLGRSRPPTPDYRAETPSPASTSRLEPSEFDLSAVEARCRLKAKGLRWASTRRRRIDEGADFRSEIAPGDQEILDRGGDLGCYLWMNSPDFTVPNEPALLENVAGWFDAVAEILAVTKEMRPAAGVGAKRDFFEAALNLLAEAQSALRVAISRIGGPNDPDQYQVYGWLRGVTAREQIYIRQYMRLDDPADPARLRGFEARVKALGGKFHNVRGRAKKQKSVLNRLGYHAKLIGRGAGGQHDWRKIFEATDELLGLEIAASNVDLREVLLPVLDVLPEGVEFSQGFNLVLREIDRYLASRPSRVEATAADVPTAEVSEVAELLSRKCVLLIGGVRRPEAHQMLRAAFGLEDLVWFETREHESIDMFEPYVARAEVALVLLAIRWSSHSFGDVKKFCDAHGKPMVRLPAGYGVNQVAAQILAQCSGQLWSR